MLAGFAPDQQFSVNSGKFSRTGPRRDADTQLFAARMLCQCKNTASPLQMEESQTD